MSPEKIHTIMASDHLDVLISQDTSANATDAVSVTGPAARIGNIGLNFHDSTITLSDDNSCRWSYDISARYTVHVKVGRHFHGLELHDDARIETLDTIKIHGSIIFNHYSLQDCKMMIDIRDKAYFIPTLNSGGGLRVYGRAEIFVGVLNEASFLEARDFISYYTYVFNKGPNDAHVHPISELGVSIYYTGNVYVHHKPEKDVGGVRTGTGKQIDVW